MLTEGKTKGGMTPLAKNLNRPPRPASPPPKSAARDPGETLLQALLVEARILREEIRGLRALLVERS